MFDILIKSYNRPYYLDRCLYSIQQFVVDNNYNLVILDDGTPDIYLNKIIEKYPKVTIHKSSAYAEKSVAALKGLAPKNKTIPIDLWIDGAKNASNYFLLLEDDIWFTKKVRLSSLIENMKSNKGVFTKLFWLGNNDLIQNKKIIQNDFLNYITPKIPFKSPFLFWFFFKVNRYKIYKISKFLKIYTVKKKNSYYSIYSVAGVFFKKEYFLELWKNHNNSVDEKLQILNALTFIRKKKSTGFAYTKNEYLKTGFISSATNKSFIKEKCDMHQLNAFFNKLWFHEKFDSYKNLKADFSEDFIENLLLNNNYPANSTEWKNWSKAFKNHFKKMGCNLN